MGRQDLFFELKNENHSLFLFANQNKYEENEAELLVEMNVHRNTRRPE
jgi:hypothetical protein